MSDTSEIKVQIEALRQQTMTIFHNLVEKTPEFNLPVLPADIEKYQKKLATNLYNVLVVGEAKRGKTSFVNALIGRELLPTDVGAATSQVFRVRNKQEEAYRLCFENSPPEKISREELTTYGSQTAAENKEVSRFDLEQLRWIEVDVPVHFLPEDVALLDTPGLGSVYAAHAIITQRFVPQADAVIYVLESRQPLGELDLKFIQEICKVTPHIFFIQTKIDIYDQEEWQQQQQRHVAILQDHFKDLTDIRVWPISNNNLLKFEATKNPVYLKVSRQKELIEALEKFLFRVSGGSQCLDALVVANHYHTTSRQILAERLMAIETNSTQELGERQQSTTQQKQQLEQEWGASGKERRVLRDKAKQIVASGKQDIADVLESGGTLETSQRKKISEVKSIKEVNDLGQVMYEQVVAEVTSTWRTTYKETKEQCALVLNVVGKATDEIVLTPNDPNLSVRLGSSVHEKENLQAALYEAQGDFIGGVQIALAAAPLAIVFFHVAIPIALIGVAIAGVLAATRGWGAVRDSQLKDAQDKLYDYLSKTMQEVRKQFLQPNIRYGGTSLLNHDFDAILEKMEERIEEVVKTKIEKAHQESSMLEEQIKMSKQQRKEQAEKFRQQLAVWDTLGDSISTTAEKLKTIGRSLTEEATPSAK